MSNYTLSSCRVGDGLIRGFESFCAMGPFESLMKSTDPFPEVCMYVGKRVK